MEEDKSLTYPQIITIRKSKYILIKLYKDTYGGCHRCYLSQSMCWDSFDLRKIGRICTQYDEYYVPSSLLLINYVTSGQYKRFLQDNV